MTAKFPDTDAVITWVDGDAPAHIALRDHYIASSNTPLHENAVNPHRWGASDEIQFCLSSINRFAPWVRKIWIVAEGREPDLSALPQALRGKVSIVSHSVIFAGAEGALPTFNSLAIETAMWRIDGLAEQFLYFNDDCFLTAPLAPNDVFLNGAPVLRGKWVNYSRYAGRDKHRRDPAKFNHYMQLNAAQMAGFSSDYLFAAAHVVHPMRRSVLARLYDRHAAAFEANMKHRFRDLSQFLPQGLHNHACIAAEQAEFQARKDHMHIKSGQGRAACNKLRNIRRKGVKMLCVNDLPQLEALAPEVRPLLDAIVTGADLPR